MDEHLKKYLEEIIFRGKIIDIKRGRGGLIFLVKLNDSDHKVAFKTVQEFESQNVENIARLNREAKNWFSVSSHPLVITPFYIEKVNGFPFICMPYCEGDLRELIDSRPTLLGTVLLSVQIIKSLLSVKARGLKNHQDLKPENILYQDLTKKFTGLIGPSDDDAFKYHVRLADFGVANAWDDGHTGGTNCYKAPEQYTGNVEESFEPDIFAVGVIMAELYQGYHPASDDPEANVQNWRGSKLKRWANNGPHHLSAPTCGTAEELVKLIKEMLNQKPQDRPSLECCFSRLMEMLSNFSQDAKERLDLALEYFDELDAYCETESYVHRLLKLATIESERDGVVQTLYNKVVYAVEEGIKTNEELVITHHILKGLDRFINKGLSEKYYTAIEECTKLIIIYVVNNHSSISSDLLYPSFSFRQTTPRKLTSDLEVKTEFLRRGINRLKTLERYDEQINSEIVKGGKVINACILMSKASEEHTKGDYKSACKTLKQVISLAPPELELENLYNQWCKTRDFFERYDSLIY